jgi:hypothetical protein
LFSLGSDFKFLEKKNTQQHKKKSKPNIVKKKQHKAKQTNENNEQKKNIQKSEKNILNECNQNENVAKQLLYKTRDYNVRKVDYCNPKTI